jgi:hypothetical protein
MISAEFDPASVQRINEKLSGMLKKIDHFGRVEMGQIMSAWQTDDLHRQRPFTKRSRGKIKKVETVIRPHSLWEMSHSHWRRVHKQRAPRHLRRRRHYRRWSTRPILRAGLDTKLFSDMIDAFHRAIKWGSRGP